MLRSLLTVAFVGTALSSSTASDFKKKIHENLTPEAKAEIYDNVLSEVQAAAMAIPDAAVEDFWELRDEYSSQPISRQCQSLQTEFDSLNNHYSTMLSGPLAEIDARGTIVVDNLGLVEELEEDLKTTKDVVKTVKAIMTGLTFLPVVGNVMNTAKTLLTQFENQVIDKTIPAVRNMNKAVGPVKTKVESALEKNTLLSTKLTMGETYFMEMVYYPLFFGDMICPSATQGVCNTALNPVRQLNGQLETAKSTMVTIASTVGEAAEGLGMIADFIGGATWKGFVSFMNKAADLLAPFEAILNKRFCVNFVFAKYCFTIGEALNVIGNLVGALANIVMKAIKKLIPPIELPIPAIDLSFVSPDLISSIPEMPDLPDALPNTPGFTCDLSVGSLPSLSDGPEVASEELKQKLKACFPIVFPDGPPQCTVPYSKNVVSANLVSKELKFALDASTADWEEKKERYASTDEIVRSQVQRDPGLTQLCSGCGQNCDLQCLSWVARDVASKEVWEAYFKMLAAEKAYNEAVEHAKMAAIEASEQAALEAQFAGIGAAATSAVMKAIRTQQATRDALEAAAQEQALAGIETDLQTLSSIAQDGADIEVSFNQQTSDLNELADQETKDFVAQLNRYSAEAETSANEIETLSKSFYSPIKIQKQPITLDPSISRLVAALKANALKFSLPTRKSTTHKVAQDLKNLGVNDLVFDPTDPGYDQLATNCQAASALGGNQGRISKTSCYRKCLENDACAGFDFRSNNYCYLKSTCEGQVGRGRGYRLKTN